MATRSIGACRWMYSPLRRRRWRNSSSLELAGEKTARLVAKLRDALVDQRLVDGVIAVHADNSNGTRRFRANNGPV